MNQALLNKNFKGDSYPAGDLRLREKQIYYSAKQRNERHNQLRVDKVMWFAIGYEQDGKGVFPLSITGATKMQLW